MNSTSSFGRNIENLEPVAKRTRKRAKPNNDEADKASLTIRPKKRVKKSGKLAQIMEIPMDILFEIFGHLRPLDVLHLARCTKELRRVLMHRSAAPIWKAARANVPRLPDCPSYLDEPAYANLAFDPHCHICLAPNVRSVEWVFRVRLCAKCAKSSLFEQSCDAPFYPTSAFGDFPYRIVVPTRPAKKSGREVIYLNEFSKELERFALATSLKGDARDSFFKVQEERIESYQVHAVACQQWYDLIVVDRARELDEIRFKRKTAIIAKLTQLGWRDEICMLMEDDDLDNHKLVKQPTLLTERIWKNISGPLIEYMEAMRAKRLARERTQLIYRRKRIAIEVLRSYKMSELPFTKSMPESADFCALPPVVKILELPSDVDVTVDSFVGIKQSLLTWIRKWRSSVKAALVQMVKHSQGGGSGDNKESGTVAPEPTDNEAEARLRLATTVFRCLRCSDFRADILEVNDDEGFDLAEAIGDTFASAAMCRPLFFPYVIGHRCLTIARNPAEYELGCGYDPSSVLLRWLGWRGKWSADSLVVDEKLGRLVGGIIQVCGLDADKVTAKEMDERDDRLACIRCAEVADKVSGYGKVRVYGWREALQHAASEHKGKKAENWYLLSQEEDALARGIEAAIRAKFKDQTWLFEPPHDEVVWSCAHCRDLPEEQPILDLDDVIFHIIEDHDVEKPKLNVDYFQDFAASQIYATVTPSTYSICMIQMPKSLGNARVKRKE